MKMDFEFKWGLHSNIPDILKNRTLRLPHGTELSFQNDSWTAASKLSFEGSETVDPFEVSRRIVTEDILWFQVNLKNTKVQQPFLFVNQHAVTFKHPVDGREMIRWSLPMSVLGKPLPMEALEEQVSGGFVDNFIKSDPLKEETLKMSEVPLYYLSKAIEENFTDRKEYRFLNLIICLESIVAGTYSSTERICRRAALLVASDYPDMQQTFEKLKNMYNLRNKFFHGGSFPSIKDEIISELFNLVRVATRNYLILLNVHGNPDSTRNSLDKFLDAKAIKTIVEQIENRIS